MDTQYEQRPCRAAAEAMTDWDGEDEFLFWSLMQEDPSRHRGGRAPKGGGHPFLCTIGGLLLASFLGRALFGDSCPALVCLVLWIAGALGLAFLFDF